MRGVYDEDGGEEPSLEEPTIPLAVHFVTRARLKLRSALSLNEATNYKIQAFKLSILKTLSFLEDKYKYCVSRESEVYPGFVVVFLATAGLSLYAKRREQKIFLRVLYPTLGFFLTTALFCSSTFKKASSEVECSFKNLLFSKKDL
ncbi:uncharacterized protein LOC135145378 [Zophobas morio]|uniref:uncharacterized protein LOC135145378 n=1 Tax=Zophobas morio TaxID=2755281 RepID=UPI0030833149